MFLLQLSIAELRTGFKDVAFHVLFPYLRASRRVDVALMHAISSMTPGSVWLVIGVMPRGHVAVTSLGCLRLLCNIQFDNPMNARLNHCFHPMIHFIIVNWVKHQTATQSLHFRPGYPPNFRKCTNAANFARSRSPPLTIRMPVGRLAPVSPALMRCRHWRLESRPTTT